MVADENKFGFELHFERDAGLVRLVYRGTAHLNGLIEATDTLINRRLWQPRMKILTDLRNVDMSDLNSDDFRNLAAHVSAYDHRHLASKSAAVVNKPLEYGLSRVFMTNAEMDDVPTEQKLFGTVEEAEEWLGVKKEDGEKQS